MLIRFIVSNFLSFKEETEFNMLASADQKHHKDHIYQKQSLNLLKAAALYGANGAGKSNLIKAIDILKRIVQTGGNETLMLAKKYKLDQECLSLPTSFEVEFVKNNVIYLYGVKIQDDEILEEWLYKSGLGLTDDEIIFHRKIENKIIEIEFSKEYSRTDKDRNNLDFIRNNLVNNNTILLKILSDLKEGFKVIKAVFEWFLKNLIIIFPQSKPEALVPKLIKSKPFKEFANNSLCSFNTGISSIDIDTSPLEGIFEEGNNNYLVEIKNRLEKDSNAMIGIRSRIYSEEIIAMIENEEYVVKRIIGKHQNKKNELIDFYLNEESDGTVRLLELIPALFDFLNIESVVLIDEIDQSIHPVLLKELVKKFVSDQKTKGQFIFTTHEANLLDQSIFRRDEIWFVEKDDGETKLYPLSDFDIRYDLDIRKGYLNGRFGAIPFMGDLQNLNWDQYAEAE